MSSDLISEFIFTTGGIIILIVIALITGSFARRLMARAVRLEYERRQESGGSLSLKEQQRDARRDWWAAFWQGISTEMVGAVMTTIIFGIALVVLQENQAQQRLKEDLLFDLGSPANAFALRAARRLEVEGWLSDGSVRGLSLANADLTRASLLRADMRDVDLSNALLVNATLTDADLSNATFRGANLDGAFFFRTNLAGADFTGANLTNVKLWDANMEGATFSETTTFSTTTRLPDFSAFNVVDGVIDPPPLQQLERFINPYAPDYWRSSNDSSPAFEADDG